jgi:Ni,Fe-hydrogenase III small subunit
MFADAYGVVGPVDSVIPVDLQVRGCPPAPQDLVTALRSLTGR